MVNTNNICIFEGRLTKEPTYTTINTQNGPLDKAVFNIAVDRGVSAAQRQANPNMKTADFVSFSLVGNQVKTLKQYFCQGKAIHVVARFSEYQTTDQQTGQTKYGYMFEADHIGFVVQDSKAVQQNGANGGGNNNGGYQQNNNNGGYQQNNNGYQNQNNGYQQNNNGNYNQNYNQNQQNNAPQPPQFEMFGDGNQPF